MKDNNLPIHLQIEPTQFCNLECAGCSIVDTHKKKERKTLSLAEIKILVDHSPSVNDISLHGLGEPLLNNDLSKITTFLKQRNIKARIVTNGNVMNPHIDNLALLESLDEICFSIDGDDSLTYERIRKGGDLEKFKRNVLFFSELRGKNNIETCTLSFNCVISKDNINNVLNIPDIAYKLGITNISINFLGQFYYFVNDEMFMKVNEKKETNLENLHEVSECLKEKCSSLDIKISIAPIVRKRYLYCHWPLRAAFVTANGYVTLCNYRMDPNILNFGNLFENTLEEIWFSEKYMKFREDFINTKYHDFCLTCN